MIIEHVAEVDVADPCPEAQLEGYFSPPHPKLVRSDGSLSKAVTEHVRWGEPIANLAAAARLRRAANAETHSPSKDEWKLLLANAVADLTVTGTRAYAALQHACHDGVAYRAALLKHKVMAQLHEIAPSEQSEWESVVDAVVNRCLGVAWALYGDPQARRDLRPGLGWLAVSAEHDPPSRPVNIPAAPWPCRDLRVPVSHQGRTTLCRVRYAVASGRPLHSTSPTDATFPAPVGPPQLDPAARVVLFVHGHSSRLEEALPLWQPLSDAGLSIIAFDLPAHGYSELIDPERVAPLSETRFDPQRPECRAFGMLAFFEAFSTAFVDALDAALLEHGQVGVSQRVVAVLGGSFGGNIGLRLAERLLARPDWLPAVVAWSPASLPPSLGRATYGFPGRGEHFDPAAKQALMRTRHRIRARERAGSRAQYLRLQLVGERLINDGTWPFQLATWGALYGAAFLVGGWLSVLASGLLFETLLAGRVVFRQSEQWIRAECRDDSEIGRTTRRLTLIETYSALRRQMHWRIAYEQLLFSHGDEVAASRGQPCIQDAVDPVLLVVGAEDRSPRYDIYEAAQHLAPEMQRNRGRTVFVQKTGHAISDERPRWLSARIVSFLRDLKKP